ncbi:MAG: hypothetical protein K0R83_1974, partial [Caulobacter sp.]|nr:hypothetical protein [Caulobacter sp.]
MRAVLPLVAMLALAACEKPKSAPAVQPAPKVEARPPPVAGPAATAPPGERWRGVPSPTGLAAVFGPARSDNSAYRMECRDGVLTVWVFHEDEPPPGRAAGEMALRKASGEVLVKSSADAEPDDLGTRLVFNLPQAYAAPVDHELDLELGLTLPGEATG